MTLMWFGQRNVAHSKIKPSAACAGQESLTVFHLLETTQLKDNPEHILCV